MQNDVSRKITSDLNVEKKRRASHGLEIMQLLPSIGARTFTEEVVIRSSRWKDRTALVYGKRSMTYEEMRSAILRIRNTLFLQGVVPGTRVALIGLNSDVYVLWYLSILAHGAVAIPLNNRLVAAEVSYILNHASVTHAVIETEFMSLMELASGSNAQPLSTIEISRENWLLNVSDKHYTGAEPEIDEKSISAIYYTSGTTGNPKGVLHTHRSLIADALQSPVSWEYDFSDCRSLAVTPLFHIASHTIFLPVLFNGGSLAIDNYTTQGTLDLIHKLKINTFFAVPSVLLLLVEKARQQNIVLDEVRVLMFGAAPMTISKLAEVQQLFPNASLVHGMGQTESGGTLVTLPGFLAMDRAGSVGLPMPGVEVAIFDESDRPVPHDTVGELVARGPNIMLGYLNDADATSVTLRNGWLHTGDLGRMSSEGLVTLVDRKKDMIIRGGENIYSCEIEQALLKHSAISGAAVVGIPDDLFGEQVGAYLVARDGQSAPTLAQISEHCSAFLADYKIPVAIKYLKELPQTATGKIRKAELRNDAAVTDWEK